MRTISSVAPMQRKSLFRGLFADFFGLEKVRWANCAQLPRFGGSAPETAVFKQTTGEVFMQTKLLCARSCRCARPAAAMAQSTVEIYGRANLGSITGGQLALRRRRRLQVANRIFDSGSRLGFRVNEALGGGMRAFVVMESVSTSIAATTSAQAGGANANGRLVSGRRATRTGSRWRLGRYPWGRQSIWWSTA